MRKRITFAIAIGALAIPAAAMADSSVTTFDGFSLSNVNPSYDVGVVTDGIQGPSLRMSNAVTSGSFGDWVFSKPTLNPAGESVANHNFVGEFKFKSFTGKPQPGLQISMSPDNGQGARMSFLRLADMTDGIHVLFAENRPPASTEQKSTDIATVNRTAAHTVRIELKMLPGRNNDQVTVYVDGVKKVVGKSWENYYRDSEGHEPGVVDRMIFQARTSGGTAMDTLGKGFLIDNVSISTSL